MTHEIERRGDLCKCPACGWRLDSEAYRCPRCFIFFCYICRARVGTNDEQYQCANQSCDCYGKLVCSKCFETRVSHRTEKVLGATTENLRLHFVAQKLGMDSKVLVDICRRIGMNYGSSLATISVNDLAKLLNHLGREWDPPLKEYTRSVDDHHRCCAQCKQPLENLS